MTGNKWDITINKVEGVPSKFGKNGAHICVPREWLKTTVISQVSQAAPLFPSDKQFERCE